MGWDALCQLTGSKNRWENGPKRQPRTKEKRETGNTIQLLKLQPTRSRKIADWIGLHGGLHTARVSIVRFRLLNPL